MLKNPTLRQHALEMAIGGIDQTATVDKIGTLLLGKFKTLGSGNRL